MAPFDAQQWQVLPPKTPSIYNAERLIPNKDAGAGVDLGKHIQRYGELPVGRRRSSSLNALIEQVERSGLRGRGGAAFPFAIKLKSVAAQRRRPVVVVNGSEGEPLSIKDRVLMTLNPHLVLDGAVSCARALDAKEIVVVIARQSTDATRSMTEAVRQRDYMEPDGVPIRILEIPHHYVSGEAGSVIRFIGGGPALPRGPVPRPDQQGVKRRPTLLSNAETFAHVGLIARRGGAWFAREGVPTDRGTRLLTITSRGQAPIVVEVPSGVSAADVLSSVGLNEPAACLVGGFAGTWVMGSDLAALSMAAPPPGSTLTSPGVGLLVPVDDRTCLVTETARIVDWMAGESAGQCGPCINGLPLIAEAVNALADRSADQSVLTRIEHYAGLVVGRGACHHPGGTVKTLRSMLEVAREDVAAHMNQHMCLTMEGSR